MTHWTVENTRQLIRLTARGVTAAEIARHTGRTPRAVRQKRARLRKEGRING